jgi:hypothetical protein
MANSLLEFQPAESFPEGITDIELSDLQKAVLKLLAFNSWNYDTPWNELLDKGATAFHNLYRINESLWKRRSKSEKQTEA